uniref:Uncharacterized protein n=1 Tax=Amphimedon queenslandica TaxID=400682 RepID=A0A1X7STG0_AMPQE
LLVSPGQPLPLGEGSGDKPSKVVACWNVISAADHMTGCIHVLISRDRHTPRTWLPEV